MSEKAKLIKEIEEIERQKLISEINGIQNKNTPKYDEIAETFGRSIPEALTLGVSEPVIGGANAVLSHVQNAAFGDADWTDTSDIGKEYDKDVAHRRQMKDDHAVADIAGQVFGSVIPTPSSALKAGKVLDALNLGNKVSKAVGIGAKALSPEGKTVLSSLGRVAVAGADSAAQALAQEGVRRGIESETGYIKPEDQLPSMTDVAATGAKFGAGLKALPELAGQAGRLGKGIAQVYGRVAPENVEAYLKDPEAIRSAPSMAVVKEKLDGVVQNLRDAVDEGKLDHADAKTAMAYAQQQVNNLVSENKNLINQEKFEIRQSLKDAVKDFDYAKKEKLSEVQQARYPVIADDVLDSVENIKKQVSDLSSESYRILGEEKGKLDISKLPSKLEKIKNDMKVGGVSFSRSKSAAHDKVMQYQERFQELVDNTKGKLSFPEVKAIIQDIDNDIADASNSQSVHFSNDSYNALMKIRGVLDSDLKTRVAGYKEIMGETSGMLKKFEKFTKAFGSREKSAAALQNIGSNKNQLNRELLGDLGTHTGKDFVSPLDEYMATKAQTATPIAKEETFKQLPEFDRYQSAVKENAMASRPGFRQEMIDKAMTVSPEAQELRKAQGTFGSATQKLTAANEALQPYKMIKPETSQNFIKSLMFDPEKQMYRRQVLKDLDLASDTDFEQIINNMRVKESFERSSMNGSSNVNTWAALSAAFGTAFGGPAGGIMAAGPGAAFGKIMDVFGPRITRSALDGILKIKGIPTVKKIDHFLADLPDDLRTMLKDDLVRAVTFGNNTGHITIAPEQIAEMRKDIQRDRSLNSIEKAKAIKAMNQNGVMDSAMMQKMMTQGHEAPTEARAPIVQPRPALNVKTMSDIVQRRKQEAY